MWDCHHLDHQEMPEANMLQLERPIQLEVRCILVIGQGSFWLSEIKSDGRETLRSPFIIAFLVVIWPAVWMCSYHEVFIFNLLY